MIFSLSLSLDAFKRSMDPTSAILLLKCLFALWISTLVKLFKKYDIYSSRTPRGIISTRDKTITVIYHHHTYKCTLVGYNATVGSVSAQNLTSHDTCLTIPSPLTRERASWFGWIDDDETRYLELPVPGNWHAGWAQRSGEAAVKGNSNTCRDRPPLFSTLPPRQGANVAAGLSGQRENGLVECKVTSNLQLRPLLRPFRCLWSGCLNYGPEAPESRSSTRTLNARWPRY